jgi:CBS domain-containing protein
MKVIPAPCNIISGELSIRDAIEQMRENDTSYVLVTGENDSIKGIFTDRDLLINFNTFQTADKLEQPISTLMSEPVEVLPLKMIHTVAQYMVKHNIRHVPIVSADNADAENETGLIGIITEREIFKSFVAEHGTPQFYSKALAAEEPRKVGVVSPDKSIFNLIDRIFEESELLNVKRLMMTDLHNEDKMMFTCDECDAIVIDIDNSKKSLWTPILKFFLEYPELENVCVLYTKSKHPNLIEVMEKIENRGLLAVYEKPVNIGEMILELEMTWNRR